MRSLIVLVSVLAALVSPGGALAEVKASSESGFSVSFERRLAATPAQVWTALVAPSGWWSAGHSWSGNAANFSLDPAAGGCFCERWGDSSVEHARVVHAVPGSLLRLSGALGPLQAEALSGTLSFALKADGAATVLTVDYVVGGHARFSLKDIAPLVDGVIGEQVTRLAGLFPPAP